MLQYSLLKYNEGSPLYPEVVEYMNNYRFEEAETLAELHTITEYDLEIHQKDILFINKNIIK
jgi:hypothetical protein